MSTEQERTLRVPWGNPITLDSALQSDTISELTIDLIFSGLAEQNEEKEMISDVARGWDVSEDGREYVFHLRDDVTWSDGIPVTAGDFEYAWKRMLDPNIRQAIPHIGNDVKGAQAFREGKAEWDQVGVHAQDDLTLVVQLEAPTSLFLNNLVRPVPRHVVEAKGATWTQVENIVTNGPFRLEAWTPGQSMVLSRDPTYHGSFPGNVERVELHVQGSTPEARAEALAMYERDDLDIWWLSPEEGPRAREQHPDEYITAPSSGIGFIGFDVSRAPFDDVQVRRAFALATDREALAREALGGLSSPATGGMVPPGLVGHTAGIALPHDPDRARQLLAEAGFPGGSGFPEVDALAAEGARAECQFLEEQWNETLGVIISWEILDLASAIERLDNAPPQMSVMGWNSDDPDGFLRTCVARLPCHWKNDTHGELVEKARHLTDQEERIALYSRADKILIEEAPIVPLTYGQTHLLAKPWVKVSKSLVASLKYVVIEPR